MQCAVCLAPITCIRFWSENSQILQFLRASVVLCFPAPIVQRAGLHEHHLHAFSVSLDDHSASCFGEYEMR